MSEGLTRLSRIAHGVHAQAARDPGYDRALGEAPYSFSPSTIMANSLGLLIPLFCWQASGNESFAVLFGFALATAAFRLASTMRYRRAAGTGKADEEIRRWDRRDLVGATALSTVLGTTSYVALALTNDIPCHIVTIAGAIAFSAWHVARNAGRPTFVIIQLFCFAVPICIGLWQANHPFSSAIGLFIGLFILANVWITFSVNRNLLELAAARKTSDMLAASLRGKNVTLHSALNSIIHGLVMFDSELRLEVSNLRFAHLYRLEADHVKPGTLLTAILDRLIASQALSPAAARSLGEVCRRAIRSRQASSVEVVTERGEVLVVRAEVTPDDGILMLTEDATERKAAAAQIERMAHTDNLTGLPNRFRFTQVLKVVCAQADENRSPFAVLYVDLDNFKLINDSLGHEAGDRLLIQVAQRLQGLLSHGELVARFGGDEFLLLCSVDPAGASTIATRIVEAMTPPFDLLGTTIHTTTSVGVALVPEHGRDPSDVLRAADMALYAAKAAGRNRVVTFEPGIATELNTKRELEQDLREACRTGSLFLHYQPIINLSSGAVVSYEALMRWPHPTRGMVPPSDFIPIAEQTGLIADMGDWALRRACMDASAWPGEVAVAVNVSGFQFKNTGRLIEAVKDALLVSGLPPNRLELEVTESLLIEDQDATLEAIRALHRIGVRFSLDDFGIGYSSLAYLARYPFSKVKIDRTFAQNVTSDRTSRAIIEVVCQLADRLGMRVVVEGIETEQQRRAVELIGAEQAQGYLFGRPQAVDAVMARGVSAA